jgi:hypothetical protein
MDGLFPNIFHGERSELCEKYGPMWELLAVLCAFRK